MNILAGSDGRRGLALRAAVGALLAIACVRTRVELVSPVDTAPAPSAVPVPEPAAVRDDPAGPTSLRMRGVDFHVAPRIVLHVRHLLGDMVSIPAGRPVDFDDRRAVVIRVAAADASITTEDLGRLLDDWILAYPGAPLSHVRIDTEHDRLRVRATLHRGVDLPVELVGEVSATPDGEIRLHPRSIRVGRVPAGPLLHLVGVHLSNLVSLRGARGARIHGDDLLLRPDSALPPPHVLGRITAARVEPGAVRLTFDSPAAAPGAREASPPDTAGNFLYLRGGTLRIGKLYMVQADLEIVDAHPSDPLDFSLADYQRQLVAGHERVTRARGLVVYVPDLDALDARGGGAVPPAP